MALILPSKPLCTSGATPRASDAKKIVHANNASPERAILGLVHLASAHTHQRGATVSETWMCEMSAALNSSRGKTLGDQQPARASWI